MKKFIFTIAAGLFAAVGLYTNLRPNHVVLLLQNYGITDSKKISSPYGVKIPEEYVLLNVVWPKEKKICYYNIFCKEFRSENKDCKTGYMMRSLADNYKDGDMFMLCVESEMSKELLQKIHKLPFNKVSEKSGSVYSVKKMRSRSFEYYVFYDRKYNIIKMYIPENKLELSLIDSLDEAKLHKYAYKINMLEAPVVPED